MEQELSSSTKVTVEGNISEGIGDMPDEEGVAKAEKVFEELRRSRRVKEDELLDLKFGTE